MSLFRLFEPLRAPDGVGGGAPPLVAEATPAIALAGPLTVAPAEAAPAIAPAIEAAPAIAPIIAPVIEPEIKLSESLLSGAKSRAELKAAPAPIELPAPAEGGDPAPASVPAIAGQVEPQPKPKPTTYEFKLPQGVELPAAGVKEFTDILTSNAEDKVSQATAQLLLDKYFSEMQRILAEKKRADDAWWANKQDGWRKAVRQDPVLGKSLEHNLSICKALIEDYAASPEDAAEIFAHLDANGMCNFPPFLRLMHKIGGPSVLNVFEDSIVPAQAPIGAAVTTRGQRWYGDSNPQNSA